MASEKKVALITGASSGIGRATALAFIGEGVNVGGIARRVDKLRQLTQDVEAHGGDHGEFLALEGDVTQSASIQQAVDAVLARWGRIDYLIANAGVGHRGAMVDAEWQDMETLLRTNIDGVLHSIRAVVPTMRQQQQGHIFTVSSVAYNLISPHAATYAASKAFVTSMANSLRLELAPDHIDVTDLLVGRTNTEFNEKRLGEGKRTGGGIPTMSPEVVASAIVKATHHPKKTIILRPFDRLLVWGNRLIPDIIGKLAERQYK